LGLPTNLLAGDCKGASRSFCGLLGLGVLDFVKTHIYHFLSFLYLNYSTLLGICQPPFYSFQDLIFWLMMGWFLFHSSILFTSMRTMHTP
jgi:hypothetical protein